MSGIATPHSRLAVIASLIAVPLVGQAPYPRPSGLTALPVGPDGLATTAVGRRFERAESLLAAMAAARNKPEWREAANRIRSKRKNGRLGTGPCRGDAATKPNTVEGSPPTWRWEKENPDNFTVVNEADFNPEGDYNPPDPGFPPETPSDAVQDAMLSSALLHEDCHSNQDGEQTQGTVVSKQYYQNEYEAHRLQVD